MIEIVLALALWTTDFIPLWTSIVISVVLFIRFTYRVILTMSKLFKYINGGD